MYEASRAVARQARAAVPSRCETNKTVSAHRSAHRRELAHAPRRVAASLFIRAIPTTSAIALVVLLGAAHSARAQGDFRAAAATPEDTASESRTSSVIKRSSHVLPYVFFGAMAAGLAVNSVVHLDRDPGGYRDTWNTEASFPDKVVHGLAAFALTSVGVDLRVRPLVSAVTTCAAGAIFESTQGYVSRYDIGADCAGAALAGLWRHWRQH